jgi:hypothetical protein
VPDLNASLAKYLLAVKPLLNSQEFETTKNLAADFANGIGQRLQQLLVERSNKTENWVRASTFFNLIIDLF